MGAPPMMMPSQASLPQMTPQAPLPQMTSQAPLPQMTPGMSPMQTGGTTVPQVTMVTEDMQSVTGSPISVRFTHWLLSNNTQPCLSASSSASVPTYVCCI